MFTLNFFQNSSSTILRELLILLAVRNKVIVIENRHLDIKGIIPDGEKRLDFDVPTLQRKYKWFDMIKQRRSTDMYIQKLEQYLFENYNQRIENLRDVLVKENCEKLEHDLSEKLKEMKELNNLMKEKQEGSNGSTTQSDLEKMDEQLKIKKGDYKKLEKNVEDRCTKVKKAIDHMTYDEFLLNFCHSLAYSVENTNKIVTYLEFMELKALESLKAFDGVVDEYVSIFYNAVVKS